MSVIDEGLIRVKKYEKCVRHLFLDSSGNVAIGYQHVLPGENDAVKLILTRNIDGLPSTIVDKIAEWNNIKGIKGAVGAASFAPYCTLSLSQVEIDKLLLSDLKEVEEKLTLKWKQYSSFPGAARQALLDLAFNIGVETLGSDKSYSLLVGAINEQNWQLAAQHCVRQSVTAQRNKEIKQLFTDASGTPEVANGPVTIAQAPGPIKKLMNTYLKYREKSLRHFRNYMRRFTY